MDIKLVFYLFEEICEIVLEIVVRYGRAEARWSGFPFMIICVCYFTFFSPFLCASFRQFNLSRPPGDISTGGLGTSMQ